MDPRLGFLMEFGLRILYPDLDTLRPDHLGCYEYHRNASPNIDRIAREGVRFSRCYCAEPPLVLVLLLDLDLDLDLVLESAQI